MSVFVQFGQSGGQWLLFGVDDCRLSADIVYTSYELKDLKSGAADGAYAEVGDLIITAVPSEAGAYYAETEDRTAHRPVRGSQARDLVPLGAEAQRLEPGARGAVALREPFLEPVLAHQPQRAGGCGFAICKHDVDSLAELRFAVRLTMHRPPCCYPRVTPTVFEQAHDGVRVAHRSRFVPGRRPAGGPAARPARAAAAWEVRGPGLKAQGADGHQEPRTGPAPGGVLPFLDPPSVERI